MKILAPNGPCLFAGFYSVNRRDSPGVRPGEGGRPSRVHAPQCRPHRQVPDCEHERRLLERLKNGDEEAFEALVRTHGGRMLAVARRLLTNEDDALPEGIPEDLVKAQPLPRRRRRDAIDAVASRRTIPIRSLD